MFPVKANGVFLQMPEHAIEVLQGKGWRFYTFIGSGGARFMCSWDTEEERVRELASDIREIVKGQGIHTPRRTVERAGCT